MDAEEDESTWTRWEELLYRFGPRKDYRWKTRILINALLTVSTLSCVIAFLLPLGDTLTFTLCLAFALVTVPLWIVFALIRTERLRREKAFTREIEDLKTYVDNTILYKDVEPDAFDFGLWDFARDWSALPYPFEHRAALLASGIPLERAHHADVRSLTIEDLDVMRSLRDPRPPSYAEWKRDYDPYALCHFDD